MRSEFVCYRVCLLLLVLKNLINWSLYLDIITPSTLLPEDLLLPVGLSAFSLPILLLGLYLKLAIVATTTLMPVAIILLYVLGFIIE